VNKKIRHNESNSIEELIAVFLKENNLTKGLRQIDIKQIWKEQMGNGVASYTNKLELKGDLLIIYLNSSVLRSEFNYEKQKIIDMMNEALGENVIKRIRLL